MGSMPEHAEVVTDLVQARAGDERALSMFEARTWTGRAWSPERTATAGPLHARRRNRPFHNGLLLDNVPEYTFVLGAAAPLAATVVGLDPRGRAPSSCAASSTPTIRSSSPGAVTRRFSPVSAGSRPMPASPTSGPCSPPATAHTWPDLTAP